MSVPRDYSKLSEKELIELARNGDNTAFRYLLEVPRNGKLPLKDRLKVQAIKILAKVYKMNNSHLLDDVQQATLEKIFTSIKNFRGDSQFSTWCYTILKRTVSEQIDELKIVKPPKYEGDPIIIESVELPDNIQYEEPGPEEILSYKQTAMEMIRLKKESLHLIEENFKDPEKVRKMVEMKYGLKGDDRCYTLDEIANDFGLKSPSTVHETLKRFEKICHENLSNPFKES
ncbi:MAG: RNA polymerase sigma factor [Azoarcus sp.]|jgi:RNA polymerase sigma factor (sigma-70 family)|nr:RNA polymerase sigma factor [Azoarcus sp.]